MSDKNLKINFYLRKKTDAHSLLHKYSFHPRHTFKGIIKSQLIRFYLICMDEKNVHDATRVSFKALRLRGFSKRYQGHIKATTLKQTKSQSPNTLLPDDKHHPFRNDTVVSKNVNCMLIYIMFYCDVWMVCVCNFNESIKLL